MNQVERIIKKWKSIPEESRKLSQHLSELKMKYLSCPYPEEREWIAIDINETKEDLRKLEAEYEYLSEIVEAIGYREVAIWLKK